MRSRMQAGSQRGMPGWMCALSWALPGTSHELCSVCSSKNSSSSSGLAKDRSARILPAGVPACCWQAAQRSGRDAPALMSRQRGVCT